MVCWNGLKLGRVSDEDDREKLTCVAHRETHRCILFSTKIDAPTTSSQQAKRENIIPAIHPDEPSSPHHKSHHPYITPQQSTIDPCRPPITTNMVSLRAPPDWDFLPTAHPAHPSTPPGDVKFRNSTHVYVPLVANRAAYAKKKEAPHACDSTAVS